MAHNTKSYGWDSTEEGSYLYWLNRQRIYRDDENEWTERKRVPAHIAKLEKSRLFFLTQAIELREYEILTTRSFDSEGHMNGFAIHLAEYGSRFVLRDEPRPLGAQTFQADRFDMATKIAFCGGKNDRVGLGIVRADRFTPRQAAQIWQRFVDLAFPFRQRPAPRQKSRRELRAEELRACEAAEKLEAFNQRRR